jgi:hypothetical protein
MSFGPLSKISGPLSHRQAVHPIIIHHLVAKKGVDGGGGGSNVMTMEDQALYIYQ